MQIACPAIMSSVVVIVPSQKPVWHWIGIVAQLKQMFVTVPDY